MLTALFPVALLPASPTGSACQQVVDSAFRPRVDRPAYAAAAGPLVLVDEAHNNTHHIDGSFRPFADVLRADGYRVEALREPFTREGIGRGQILVIINALASRNVDNWILPTPSAFRPAEIETVLQWISSGGALLLVADHMPFPGAAEDLARRLGVAFTNGFAIDTVTWDPLVFRRGEGSLARHPITEGRRPAERIDSVATFWGQAMRAIDTRVWGLLTFSGPHVISYQPERAWRFSETTPTVAVTGWLQGATLTRGLGRVVILGEAGMLSAQLMARASTPAGMNAAVARQNQQFVLNIFHWLCRLLPETN